MRQNILRKIFILMWCVIGPYEKQKLKTLPIRQKMEIMQISHSSVHEKPLKKNYKLWQ